MSRTEVRGYADRDAGREQGKANVGQIRVMRGDRLVGIDEAVTANRVRRNVPQASFGAQMQRDARYDESERGGIP